MIFPCPKTKKGFIAKIIPFLSSGCTAPIASSNTILNYFNCFRSQIVNFTTPKTSTPTVIVSASHLNGAPEHNSIATWVEVRQCHHLHTLSPHIRTIRTKFYLN